MDDKTNDELATAIAKAQEAHDAYRDLCLQSDEMLIPERGEL